jgi:hypothetical protein
MLKRISYRGIVISFFVCLLFTLTTAFGQTEILLNGGLEVWDNATTPTSWYKAENITKDSIEVHSGNYCAKQISGGIPATKDLGQYVSVKLGYIYDITIWYKVIPADGSDCRIWSYWYNNGEIIIDTADELRGPNMGYFDNNGGVWTKFDTTVIPPEDVDTLYFEVRTYSGAIVYWDDLSIIETPPGLPDDCYIDIPDTSFLEDEMLSLYLPDFINNGDTINFNYFLYGNNKIYCNMDNESKIATFTVDKDLSNFIDTVIVFAEAPNYAVTCDTFSIFIHPVNDRPIISNRTINVYEEMPLAFNLEAVDVDNNELVYTLLDSTINGELTGTLPNLIYLSNIDYNGLDSLKFSVSDGQLSDTGKYIINVQAINDLPLAYSYDTTTYEDQSIQLLYNGKDIDGTFSFTVLNNPPHGTLSGSIPNQIYTPNQNYFGTDQIGFLITDNDGGKDTGYIDISIQSVNDPPQVTFSEAIINEGETKSMNLTASPGAPNESNQSLTYILRTLPNIGYISEAENGSEILQSDLPITLADPNIFFSSPEKFAMTSFMYNVQDDGGTEYNGIDTSTYQSVTISMNVATKMSLSSSGSVRLQS